MVKKEQIYIPCFHDMRTLHIYLPHNYDSSKKNYPVMYMYDGHNLFHDEDATFGTSWGLKNYLDKQEQDLIIVGIECNHEGYRRLEEFSPYDFKDTQVGEIHAQGKEFMEWVVGALKTWIDRRYRTLPSRKHTAIGGSSMGGLMALYSILHHNDTFSKAACLSPFIYSLQQPIEQEIKSARLHKDTHIYISYGSDEFRSKNQLAKAMNNFLKILQLLNEQQVSILPNLIFKGKHSEASWHEELETFIPYLYK